MPDNRELQAVGCRRCKRSDFRFAKDLNCLGRDCWLLGAPTTLDALAQALQDGNESVLVRLSTGETIYVALAASRVDLLSRHLGANLDRHGKVWLAELIERHNYRLL